MNIDSYIETLKKGGLLEERDLKLLCDKAKEYLLEESNVQPVCAPVTICGDIHDFRWVYSLYSWGTFSRNSYN